jgi:hypothetical protein
MAIDIQVLSSVLLQVMQTELQQSFNTTCLPSFESSYVDHVQVGAGTVSLTPAGAAEFSLPVSVFLVDLPSLLASVNGTPSGATTSAGSATIVLTLTVAGTTLTLACTQVSPDAKLTKVLGPLAGIVALEIKTQIGTVGTANLSAVFSSLGLPAPSTSTLAQAGTSLFIRFDPSGSPVDTLQTGQDWCLFVDATTMQNVSAAKVNNALDGISLITSHTTMPEWTPSGGVPQVSVSIYGDVTVPDPLIGLFTMQLVINFAIGGTTTSTYLLELITWSWNASTGLGSADTKEEAKVQSVFDSTGFGGTIISSNEFSFQQTLPSLSLGNAVFEYGSPVGLSTGMVLGGAVTGIGTPDTGLVSFEINQYSDKFTLADFCQGGAPPPTLGTVAALASAVYDDAAKLCAVTLISPSPSPLDLTPYLNISPPPATVTESGSIMLDFNGLVSQTMAKTGQPVEFLVQTTRGVRVISFGVPPTPKVGSLGNVTNYSLLKIDNCPIAVDPWYQVFQNFNPLWNVDPPESWVDNIEQVAAFETLIISLPGVETSELVTFDQPLDGGLTVVSAGINGQAMIPAMLAVRSSDEHAILSRANRAELGNLNVSGMIFQRVATLNTPGAVSHQLSGSLEDATVTTTFADGSTQSVLVCGLGVSAPFGMQAASNLRASTATNRTGAPIPASTTPASAWAVDIPGLVKILSIPGFEKAPVAVAKLSDGTYRVLSRHTNEPVRVVGLVPRWPDMPPVSGRWAISSTTGNRVGVFKVRRSVAPACSCECHKDSTKFPRTQ